MEQVEFAYMWKGKMVQTFWKTVCLYPIKLKIYYRTRYLRMYIVIVGIYPGELKLHVHTKAIREYSY